MKISGTVHDMTRLAGLDREWQQKKKNLGKEERQKADPMLERYKEDLKRMRENRRISDIEAKLQAGSELTEEELQYLMKENPQRYRDALEIRQEKEAFERQIKACRTKEDVEKLKVSRMGSLAAEAESIANNPNIPKGKKVELMDKLMKKTDCINKVYLSFMESGGYAHLPETKEADSRTEEAPGADEAAGFMPPENVTAKEAQKPEDMKQTQKPEDIHDGKETV